jgi:hypothetical protein
MVLKKGASLQCQPSPVLMPSWIREKDTRLAHTLVKESLTSVISNPLSPRVRPLAYSPSLLSTTKLLESSLPLFFRQQPRRCRRRSLGTTGRSARVGWGGVGETRAPHRFIYNAHLQIGFLIISPAKIRSRGWRRSVAIIAAVTRLIFIFIRGVGHPEGRVLATAATPSFESQ